MARLTLNISEKTDKSLRVFLAENGGKKGDISKFVEGAINRMIFDETIRSMQERNAHYNQQEIMDTVNEAVAWARATRP